MGACRACKTTRATVNLPNGVSPLGSPPGQGRSWFAEPEYYWVRSWVPYTAFEPRSHPAVSRYRPTVVKKLRSRGAEYIEAARVSEYVSVSSADVRIVTINRVPRLYNLYSLTI